MVDGATNEPGSADNDGITCGETEIKYGKLESSQTTLLNVLIVFRTK